METKLLRFGVLYFTTFCDISFVLFSTSSSNLLLTTKLGWGAGLNGEGGGNGEEGGGLIKNSGSQGTFTLIRLCVSMRATEEHHNRQAKNSTQFYLRNTYPSKKGLGATLIQIAPRLLKSTS